VAGENETSHNTRRISSIGVDASIHLGSHFYLLIGLRRVQPLDFMQDSLASGIA